MADKPSLIGALLGMKCPSCRKGFMYKQKSYFPMSTMMEMPEDCPVCGQKMEIQVGFYYGTGYVSYALSVGIFFINLAWYWLIFGLSWQDNSVFYYLGTSIGIILLLQPWIMRISRVLYLHMFVRYGAHHKDGREEAH